MHLLSDNLTSQLAAQSTLDISNFDISNFDISKFVHISYFYLHSNSCYLKLWIS